MVVIFFVTFIFQIAHVQNIVYLTKCWVWDTEILKYAKQKKGVVVYILPFCNRRQSLSFEYQQCRGWYLQLQKVILSNITKVTHAAFLVVRFILDRA